MNTQSLLSTLAHGGRVRAARMAFAATVEKDTRSNSSSTSKAKALATETPADKASVEVLEAVRVLKSHGFDVVPALVAAETPADKATKATKAA